MDDRGLKFVQRFFEARVGEHVAERADGALKSGDDFEAKIRMRGGERVHLFAKALFTAVAE